FESYGKSQSYNAPVGEEEAFRYSTALNRLLADTERRARIGDATVVYWTAAPSPAEAFMGYALKEERAEDPETGKRIQSFLSALRAGRSHEGLGDASVPFYVLGLSPNRSRLSVRFWCASTVGELAGRLGRHLRDLEIIGAREGDPPLVIGRIVRETGREPKDAPPLLAGELARAVLTGAPYPAALLSAILRRLRADQTINHARAAALKAYLIRNLRLEVPVSLNKDHPSPAYQLGRLFAALEKTQEDAADGKLNRTVRDSYFGTATAAPASVFPRLLRLHQHHLSKLEHEGFRINREKEIQDIVSRIDRFPAFLALEDQGLFQIGYYHQRQAFFTKKDEPTPEEVTA
ncbi:MAG: type I-C CRISPR-associated protein Cas8c/Csd1, partial [Planctomycetota bacterium]